MSVLLSISVALLSGLMMTRVVRPLKLPDVTAYLIAGILVSIGAPGILGLPIGIVLMLATLVAIKRRHGGKTA